MDQYIERGQLLIQQNQLERAEEVLRQGLAGNPNDGYAHSMLALCMMRDRDRLIDATREAETGIHLEPGQPFAFYALSLVLDRRNQLEQALEAIDQAIQLHPESANFHGQRASLLAQQNQWQACLDSAETGLRFDAEDQTCAAFRSLSLERLGKVSDALEAAEQATRQDPDSPVAHANRGWALLNKGDHQGAQLAFRESLRLDPGNEFARQGMVHSLNSNNIIFRNFYRLMMKLSRLDSRVAWGLIIGLWLGMRFLNSLARQYEWLLPWVLPISLMYLLLVMMSWIAVPLFNTFLRFHPFGKHLLSRKEKWASNLIAAAFMVGAGFAVIYAIQENWIGSVLILVYSVYLTIPLSVAFRTSAKWATWVAGIVAACFAILFLGQAVLLVFGLVAQNLVLLYQFGILIYCFAGQWLISARDRI